MDGEGGENHQDDFSVPDKKIIQASDDANLEDPEVLKTRIQRLQVFIEQQEDVIRRLLELNMGEVVNTVEGEQLLRKYAYDAVTNLLRLEPFMAILHKRLATIEVKEARRELKNGALIFIDLNDMKGMNDSLGYIPTNKVLSQFAERLQTIRQGDETMRFGGDEFVVYLHEADPNQAGYSFISRVIQSLRENPIVVKDDEGVEREVNVTFSAGVKPIEPAVSSLPLETDVNTYKKIAEELITKASQLEKEAKSLSDHNTTVLVYENDKGEPIILSQEEILNDLPNKAINEP